MFGILRTARAARSIRPLLHTYTRTFAQEVSPKSPSDSSSTPTEPISANDTETGVALRNENEPSIPTPADRAVATVDPDAAREVEVAGPLVPVDTKDPPDRASRRRVREIQAVEARYGEMRPQSRYNIDAPKEHGLYAFFKQFKNEEGDWHYTTVQAKNPQDLDTQTGRSWSAPELRRKSFKDLHTLWYILLRERNILATQKEECRRIGVPNVMGQTDIGFKAQQCRKSMARIKYVLNERRITYEGALELFAQDKARGKWGATKKEAEEAALAVIRERKQKKLLKQQRYEVHVKSRVKTKGSDTPPPKARRVGLAGQRKPRHKKTSGAAKQTIPEAGATGNSPVQTEAPSP